MNYWITTHYPPHDKDFDTPFYYGVWIQDGKEYVASEMKPGDLVFKYESLSGPSRKTVLPSGKEVTDKCPPGKMGIVAVMEMTSTMQPRRSSTPTEYADGTQRWWRHFASAIGKDIDGFVPLVQLNILLGYAPNNRLRGFGDANSGLKKISKAQYDQIYAAFKQAR